MAAQDLEQLILSISADTRQIKNALKKLEGDTSASTRRIESHFAKLGKSISGSFDGVGRSIKNQLGASVAGIGAALGVREVLAYADAWTKAKNALSVAGVAGQAQAQTLEQLYQLAQANASPLEATVQLYGRASMAAQNLGATQAELMQLTDAVGLALKVSGQGATEASGALLQLSQVLQGNTVQSEEYGSLIDGLYPLLQAAASGSKRWGGNVARLTADVKAGKVPVTEFFRAILDGSAELRTKAATATLTMEQAIGKVRNAMLRYVGMSDETASASSRLAEALSALADNFETVADPVLKFAGIIAAGLLGRSIATMIGGLGNAAAAVTALVAAMRAGTATAALFSASLGPIGLALGAAAAATVLFYDSQSDAKRSTGTFEKAIAGNKSALEGATSATYDQIEALKQLIATQAKAAQVAVGQAEDAFDGALRRAASFRDMTGGMRFAPFDLAIDQTEQELLAAEGASARLKKQLEEVNAITRPKPAGSAPAAAASGGGKSKRSKTDEFERSLQSLADQTVAIVAETEVRRQLNPLVEDYGFAVEKARAERDLLTDAERAGKEVTPQLRAEIAALAEQYALAGAESERLSDKQDEMRQSAEDAAAMQKDLARGVVDGFLEGASASEVLGNALKKLGTRFLDLAFDAAFDPKGGGAGRNLLGLLGSGLGALLGGGGGFPSAPGIGLYAKGTNYHPGGLALIGERGPELLDLPTGAKVTPNHMIPRVPDLANGSGSGGLSINNTFAPNVDMRGAPVEAVAAMEKSIRKLYDEFDDRTVVAVKAAQANRRLR